MQPFMAAFLLFSMAVSVDDHQNENDEAPKQQHDDDGLMLPDFRCKLE